MNTNVRVCLPGCIFEIGMGSRDKEKSMSVWLQAYACDKWDYINCLPLCLHTETDLFLLNVIDVAYFEMMKFLLRNKQPDDEISVHTQK